ncbi:MAG: PTS lactose/cellobiose transporter subunit IIA [Lactobacillales bacterium]|nr:PTS lactose/cellobiose transporter subunit IIA [Lactobacillales bacterium]
MNDTQMQEIMPLIIFGGEAKSLAIEAIQAAKKGNFVQADEKIQAANAAIVQAHHSQTELLTKSANGETVEVSIYMVHGQDHLMTSITFVDLAKEIIELYKVVK